MNKRFHSIRSKMVAMISVAVLISVLAIGLVGLRYIKMSTVEYLDELLMMKCENIGKTLDNYLESIEERVDAIASYASRDLSNTEELTDEALAAHIDTIDALFQAEAIRSTGILTYYYRIAPEVSTEQIGFWYQKTPGGSYVKGEMTDISAYDEDDTAHVGWFYKPKQEGRSMWLEPYENQNFDGKKMISYVTPVYRRGEFIGVLGIDYDYDALINHIKYNGHFKDADTFLTDKDGKIIYHPTLESGSSVDEVTTSANKRLLPKEHAVKRIISEGVIKRITWVGVTNGMRLYLMAPESSYKQYWFVFTHVFIAITFLLMILFVLIANLMAMHVTQPLSELTEAALKIEQNDYDVDLKYNGNDEIGVLTRTMKQLTEHLRMHIRDLNDRVYRDGLTSVRNKGAFDIYLHKVNDLLQFGEGPETRRFGICVFDCNDLKGINDCYGHDKGDLFIKNACKLICDVFGHSPVFRIGGDEFACVMQGPDYENREELYKLFENMTVEINSKVTEPWEKIDIASGAAIYEEDIDKDAQDVFRRADKNMYDDKERKKSNINSMMLDGLE